MGIVAFDLRAETEENGWYKFLTEEWEPKSCFNLHFVIDSFKKNVNKYRANNWSRSTQRIFALLQNGSNLIIKI